MCADEPLERAVARLLKGVQHKSAEWPRRKRRAYERRFARALRDELVEFDGARDGARWRVSKEEKQRARLFGGLFRGAPRAASYS